MNEVSCYDYKALKFIIHIIFENNCLNYYLNTSYFYSYDY